jgi:hypothetical protein
MRWADMKLLGKKIGIGILITLIPLGILTGGLWVSQKVLNRNPQANVNHAEEVSHAN